MDEKLIARMHATIDALRRTGASYLTADLGLARTLLIGITTARGAEYAARARQLANKSLALSKRLRPRLQLTPDEMQQLDAIEAELMQLLGAETQAQPDEPTAHEEALVVRRLFIGRSHEPQLRKSSQDQFWEVHGMKSALVDRESGLMHIEMALSDSPAARAIQHDLQQQGAVVRNWRIHDRVRRHYVRGWAVKDVAEAAADSLRFGLFVMATGDPILDPPAARAPTGIRSGHAADRT